MIVYSLMFLLGVLCGIFCAALAAAAGGNDEKMQILKLKEKEVLHLVSDLVLISQALVDIADRNGSNYGHREAVERADHIVETYTRIFDGEK